MAERHLRDLESALSRRGWRIVQVLPGDDYAISASWEVQRSTREPSVVIDFGGMDKSGDFCHPLERAYACEVRGRYEISLFFGKGPRWKEELDAFVAALEEPAESASPSFG